MSRKRDYTQLNVTPFETGIRNFSTIAKYFLYYAPNINSCQSIGKFEGQTADKILETMFEKTNIKKQRFMKRISEKARSDFEFNTNIIDFEDSRVLCNKYNNETDLSALLRHIRNALAHGYIYIWRKKCEDYILFVDFDSNRNSNKKPDKKPDKNKETAKILVSISILETWKSILESEIAKGE